MKLYQCLISSAVVFHASCAKNVEKEDLHPDAMLRIGVKYRPKECAIKSASGDTLKMHYTGTLYKDGTKFDSSVDREPLSFKLGAGNVIQGWDQGLVDMCIGEKRKLTIPSGLAYGNRGSPPTIPAKATLVFHVELVDIVREESNPEL